MMMAAELCALLWDQTARTTGIVLRPHTHTSRNQPTPQNLNQHEESQLTPSDARSKEEASRSDQGSSEWLHLIAERLLGWGGGRGERARDLADIRRLGKQLK